MSEDNPLTWKRVLEVHPPGHYRNVAGAFGTDNNKLALKLPVLDLYCDDPACSGIRIFEQTSNYLTYGTNYLKGEPSSWYSSKFFMTYRCRHCQNSYKYFAIGLQVVGDKDDDIENEHRLAHVTKFGEQPAFGPPTPSRAIKLFGEDRELFLKGRRAEFQGLGIGAFSYYRRVVENQKTRFIEKAIEVAEKNGSTQDVINILQEAAVETQFSTAIGKIKDTFPESLKINGYSPLTLLHSALSEGLHAETDFECLESATSIRLILFELAERIDQVLENQQELNAAVTRLANRHQR